MLAAKALGDIGGEEAAEALEQALHGESRHVRPPAGRGCGGPGGGRSGTGIGRFLRGSVSFMSLCSLSPRQCFASYWKVRMAAKEALEQIRGA